MKHPESRHILPASDIPSVYARGPILVVDDDSAVRDVIVASLLSEGYATREAVDGAQAVKVIEEGHTSLVILDMQMPVLDGWGVASELKARDLHPPILVVTAGLNAERVSRDVGAAGFLGKPFEITELLAKVEALRAA